MDAQNYTTSFTVDQSPDAVFAGVINVRGWWSEEIDGPTDRLGAEFTFRYGDIHRSTQQITTLEPGKKVVWRVLDSQISFATDPAEWTGTDVVFELIAHDNQTELRFTHVGLVPVIECYSNCSDAWSFYVNDSLRNLITSGKGQPNTSEALTESER